MYFFLIFRDLLFDVIILVVVTSKINIDCKDDGDKNRVEWIRRWQTSGNITPPSNKYISLDRQCVKIILEGSF